MKSFTLLAVLILLYAISGFAQTDAAKKEMEPDKKNVQTESINKSPDKPVRNPEPTVTDAVDKKKDKKTGLTATGYIRPDAEKRFKNYVNDVVGPFAWARYTLSAGVLTWRKSPDEWGNKWDGFGRRVANSLGKGAIRYTTAYALDEALKYDSSFYRSRNRSVAARLRNSVFSAVTARNKKGKRVLGVPRL
ncbi:MAG: hypothetical protein HOP17_11565, partial [Acidobacteria bacterium]|nr:hypothetical protein [Acidobacteriota bacterium]